MKKKKNRDTERETQREKANKRTLTNPLPPPHPALAIHNRNNTLKMRGRARRDAVLGTLHLHQLLAVRAPVPSEVGGGLDERAEEAGAQLAGAGVGGDGRCLRGGVGGHFLALGVVVVG